MFGLFVKKESDKWPNEFFQQKTLEKARELINTLKVAPPEVHIAVRCGLDVAQKIFSSQYEATFAKLPSKEKEAVLMKFVDIADALVKKDRYAAWGIDLFHMWLYGSVFDNPQLKAEISKNVRSILSVDL